MQNQRDCTSEIGSMCSPETEHIRTHYLKAINVVFRGVYAFEPPELRGEVFLPNFSHKGASSRRDKHLREQQC
jgi:hypothetical protein